MNVENLIGAVLDKLNEMVVLHVGLDKAKNEYAEHVKRVEELIYMIGDDEETAHIAVSLTDLKNSILVSFNNI